MNPRANRVVEPDQRHAELARGLDDIGDFFCVGATHRAGKDRAVLGEEVNRPAVNFTIAGHYPVAGLPFFRHAEVRTLGLGQHELFDETSRVE